MSTTDSLEAAAAPGGSTAPARAETRQLERVGTRDLADSAEACALLAQEVAELLRAKEAAGERAVLGLATGSTPVPFYQELIRLHREEGLSFARVLTFNLDEYFGLGRDHRESYYRFMRDQLFDHIDIPEENIHIPDGTVPREEVYGACAAYEAAIEAAGGIDLQILGIGRTGHIGFNEPGSSRESRTRLITLDRVTRQDAARDFMGIENVPRFALTMGVATILAARRVALMAWGENKAQVVAAAVEGPVTDAVSASFLQEHPNAVFLLDRAAASELTRARRPWLVGPVEWEPRTVRRAVSWLTEKVGKPVLKLVDEDYNENGMAELLTEQGSAYGLNISVFNELQHTITGWPGGKPNADDTNRPERAEPARKRVVVFSPEPAEDVLNLGATLNRLIEQGHEVEVVYQTSGNLAVPDAEAEKFAQTLLETARVVGEGEAWEDQVGYAERILRILVEKGSFGEDPPELRQLKGLIRRGEAREACRTCGLEAGRVHFLDLPFYESGRYRRFALGGEDVARTGEVLERVRPHQVYATGNRADPSSLQFLCFRAVEAALEAAAKAGAGWLRDSYGWLYRSWGKELEPHEIDMAVPFSPGELAVKESAILRHQSQGGQMPDTLAANRATARRYDQLGLAEYEAIETFQRWVLPGS